jgi:putative addiction module component (TIGR02574 family)
MTATAEKLRTKLAGLSETARAELAHFLIRSLDEGKGDDAESAWDTELGRRAEEIESGRATGEPAEKVFSELRAKYS